MTYREAQKKIESKGLAKSVTIVEQLIYTGGCYGKCDGEFRNWDDEISNEDRELLNKRYKAFGLQF